MRRLPAVALAATAAIAGCGGGGGGDDDLTVAAAASLRDALTAYEGRFGDARVRTSFAGSDQLAAQIRRGVRPDVFASSDADLPAALHRDGLVDRPVVFAGNRLVVAVPARSGIRSVEDLARPGTKVAVGSRSVPVGRYTRMVLGRIDRDSRTAILRNVRSEEPDVNGVVGKLVHGAVDAGVVYRTDVLATDGRLRAVELPAAAQPAVAYAVAVVRGGRNEDAARAFVDGLLTGDGARILRDAGFEKPR